jgi:ABC-type Fe3+ transport system substrate-binding protein
MTARPWIVVLLAGVVVALPFLFRRTEPVAAWRPGDPTLVVISPHNEAIRQEFARGFSEWHRTRHGKPVRVDWRNIGGTTEIVRYLESEYVAAFRGWWRGQGRRWPEGGEAILDRRFNPEPVPPDVRTNGTALAKWREKAEIHTSFRAHDNPTAFSSGIDLMFGGGTYDHGKLGGEGIAVPAWPKGAEPPGLFTSASGVVVIPERLSGEVWRGPTFYGATLSTFGICSNPDRMRELGVATPPERWEDLADPVWFGQLGVADPTKSGSIAKAFEMIVQEQCLRRVLAEGFTDAQITDYEARIAAARKPDGSLPDNVPAAYQAAVEGGWRAGLDLIRLIGANARYFTDSASKVPIDVSVGDAAAGVAIDFYGRCQAEVSAGPSGPRMNYITPRGGSSVSADPISLLRGAPHRELAERFIVYVLTDGQKLWNYRPGAPGGPVRYSLRRLPIRRDFYPSGDPAVDSAWGQHRPHCADALDDPRVNPYAVAGEFEYRPRWTANHFSVHRSLIRAMCMDSGEELRAAWAAIVRHGGPASQPRAMAMLQRLPDVPEPLTWATAPAIERKRRQEELMRDWTRFFRHSYEEARHAVAAEGGP